MEGGVLMRSSRDERVAALMVAGRREATCEGRVSASTRTNYLYNDINESHLILI